MSWPRKHHFVGLLGDIFKHRPPVTQERVVALSKCALEEKLYYKHVVLHVEAFISKAVSRPDHLLSGAYVIDAICRRSQAKYGKNDKFGPRFSIKLETTVQNLMKAPAKDLVKLRRLLKMWAEGNVMHSAILSNSGAASSGTIATSSSSSSGLSTSSSHRKKRSRIRSPRTPPGSPNRSFGAFRSSSNATTTGATINEDMQPTAPAPLPPSVLPVHLSQLPTFDDSSAPIFDYGGGEDALTEQSIAESKRRRLEEERRVNEVIAMPVQQQEQQDVEPQLEEQPANMMMMQEQTEPSGRKPEVRVEEERGRRVYYSTTLFVGSLEPSVREGDLMKVFGRYGEITYINGKFDRGFAFVEFMSREDAESAKDELQHTPIHNIPIKTGWAKARYFHGEFNSRTGTGDATQVPSDRGGGGYRGGGGGGGGHHHKNNNYSSRHNHHQQSGRSDQGSQYHDQRNASRGRRDQYQSAGYQSYNSGQGQPAPYPPNQSRSAPYPPPRRNY